LLARRGLRGVACTGTWSRTSRPRSGSPRGAIGPVDIGILAAKGSLFLTRPTLNTYTATRQDLLTAANDLFDVQKGVVKLAINQTYPLRDAARAHRDLRDRKTTGSTVVTV
jgi:NADPH:quinone reductase